jgi:hypothetical protein
LKKQRRGARKDDDDDDDHKNHKASVKGEDNSFEFVRKKIKNECLGVDFVKKNLELVNDWPEQ